MWTRIWFLSYTFCVRQIKHTTRKLDKNYLPLQITKCFVIQNIIFHSFIVPLLLCNSLFIVMGPNMISTCNYKERETLFNRLFKNLFAFMMEEKVCKPQTLRLPITLTLLNIMHDRFAWNASKLLARMHINNFVLNSNHKIPNSKSALILWME